MKIHIKLLILFAGMMSTFIACNNDKAGSGKEDSATANGEHQHSYRCPMNCEDGKTYDKPGKCPVCGMELEHFDGEGNGQDYTMKFTSNPAQFAAGQAATFSFTPKMVGKESEAVALDLQHEKKIHLIVVSDDLSYFEHIHPDYQADGSYQIKVLAKGQNYAAGSGKNETKFDAGGNYFMFADYKPTGSTHQVEKIPLLITGTARPATTYKGDKLSGTSGSYSAVLSVTGDKLITGALMHISGTILKQGKEIDANSLEDYLGAKAHMVVISVNEKEYLHVHPGVADGKFDLHTTFKTPGIYRGWLQFKAEGKVHTVDFTMNVTQGTENDVKNANQAHTDKHTNNTDHDH